MENFVFCSPTKIIFGKGVESNVGIETRKYADKILLHYGGSSIKKYGLYDKIIGLLSKENIKIYELPGVQPNPRLGLVNEGIKICRENDINFILAVGGGSAIDSAKAIAAGVKYDGDVWDFYKGTGRATDVLPLGVVLTIPAAGSEASHGSVITKEEGLIKKPYGDDKLRPKFAILNPEITFTLPADQTAFGISDIFTHGMERYFTSVTDVDFTDRLLEGAFKSLIRNSYIVMEKPKNYSARAEIMWISTVMHNDLLGTGRVADWASHNIEHELSAIYDIAHGEGLSIIFPAWMKYVYRKNVKKFAQFAQRVFDVDVYFGEEEKMAAEGIIRLENFYRSLGLPIRLSDIKIPDNDFEEMAQKASSDGPLGKFVRLDRKDILEIYKLAR
jgi:alcohol dehydrogenase